MSRNNITAREAQRLVSLGVYDDIDDAWEEAKAICEQSDRYEAYDMQMQKRWFRDEEEEE